MLLVFATCSRRSWGHENAIIGRSSQLACLPLVTPVVRVSHSTAASSNSPRFVATDGGRPEPTPSTHRASPVPCQEWVDEFTLRPLCAAKDRLLLARFAAPTAVTPSSRPPSSVQTDRTIPDPLVHSHCCLFLRSHADLREGKSVRRTRLAMVARDLSLGSGWSTFLVRDLGSGDGLLSPLRDQILFPQSALATASEESLCPQGFYRCGADGLAVCPSARACRRPAAADSAAHGLGVRAAGTPWKQVNQVFPSWRACLLCDGGGLISQHSLTPTRIC